MYIIMLYTCTSSESYLFSILSSGCLLTKHLRRKSTPHGFSASPCPGWRDTEEGTPGLSWEGGKKGKQDSAEGGREGGRRMSRHVSDQGELSSQEISGSHVTAASSTSDIWKSRDCSQQHQWLSCSIINISFMYIQCIHMYTVYRYVHVHWQYIRSHNYITHWKGERVSISTQFFEEPNLE